MAILVQEEKKPVNWIGMLTVIFVIVVVFVLSYFLFFKKPEIIDQVTPKSLENINELSKVRFDPEEVVSAPAFQNLKSYASPVTPRETPGKSNPFRP